MRSTIAETSAGTLPWRAAGIGDRNVLGAGRNEQRRRRRPSLVGGFIDRCAFIRRLTRAAASAAIATAEAATTAEPSSPSEATVAAAAGPIGIRCAIGA